MEQCPVIVIPGIGQSKAAVMDENGHVLKKVWPFDFDEEALIKAVRFPALRMLLLRHDLGFIKAVTGEIERQLSAISCGADGKVKQRIKPLGYGTDSYAECSEEDRRYINRMMPTKQICEAVGEDRFFFFTYFSFGNIEEIAEDLHAYIKMVKEKTQCRKVNLLPVSLGGTVLTYYLDKYAEEADINKVVAIVPAFDGSVLVSDLLCGRINTEKYMDLFEFLMGKKSAGSVKKLIGYMPKKLVKPFIQRIFGTISETLLLNCSMLWGAVPSKLYPALSDQMIGDAAHKDLKKMTDKAYRIRSDFPGLVAKGEKFGTHIYSLCGYNLKTLPSVLSEHVNSDGIVPAFSASMGAWTADIGKTIPEKREQPHTCCKIPGHMHLSPDRTVDASVSPIADRVWFFKNMEHEGAADHKQLLTLAALLLNDHGSISSVFDDPAYPQYNE